MNWTEAYLLADMEAEEMMRAEMTDSEMLAVIRALLPDTYSESKDWRTGNVTERIICLKAWLESKTEEVDRLIDILNDNRTEAQAAEIERLREALQWCSGSADFNEGGIAREGWLKLCAPLLTGSTTVKDSLTTENEKQSHEWKCPIDYQGCRKNCGSYGCGN